MKIFVTGGTGYIGSHTVVELQKNGYDVIIADNLVNSSMDVLDGIEKISGIRPEFEEIDLTDGEGARNALMAPLHGHSVLMIEGTPLLVHHDAVRLEGMVAGAVEFLRKEPFRRAKGVCRIDDDKVIDRFTAADELQGIFKMDVDTAVIQAAGIAGQEVAARFNDGRIHFYKVNGFDAVIARQFPHDTAVAGADDKDVAAVLMDRHGYMGNHFVVNEFIPFRQHDISVQGEDTAKFRCFKNIDMLELALTGIKMAIDTDAVFYIRCMKFTEPKFHISFPLISVH